MDYVEVNTAQKRNAGDQLGLTPITTPGRRDQFWPHLTGSFALKLIDYWLNEADRAADHVDDIPGSAVRTAWLRQVNILRAIRPNVAVAEPHKLMPVAVTVLVWTTIDGVFLPMRALNETPTRWDLVAESVVETLQEVGAGTKKAVVIALAVVCAVLVLR